MGNPYLRISVGELQMLMQFRLDEFRAALALGPRAVDLGGLDDEKEERFQTHANRAFVLSTLGTLRALTLMMEVHFLQLGFSEELIAKARITIDGRVEATENGAD